MVTKRFLTKVPEIIGRTVKTQYHAHQMRPCITKKSVLGVVWRQSCFKAISENIYWSKNLNLFFHFYLA